MIESITILLMGLGLIIILLFCLALIGCTVGFYAILGISVLFFIGVLLRVYWFWFVKGMSSFLPKGSKIQIWFEERYLDEQYPSRVRKRKNAKRKMKKSALTS